MSQQKTLENIERGKKLRSLRNQLGMDQKDLAPLLKIHPTYLSQLETGNQAVSDYYLEETHRLLENSKKSKTAVALHERGHESNEELWRRRALSAENDLHQLRTGLRALLELSSSTPTVIETSPDTDHQKPSSSADARLKDAVEGALADRKKK